jgi:hypothetical protein
MIRKLSAILFGAFFILVHQPAGNEVYINAEQVDYIGPNVDGDPRARSKVMVYGVWTYVLEKPAEIKAAIDAVLHQDGSK